MPWRGGGGRPRKRPCVSINICSPSPLAWPSRERPRFNRVRTCDSHKWGFQPAPLTQPHRTKPPAPCGSPDSSLAPAHQAKQGSHPPESGQAEVLCTRGRVKGWPSSPSSLGTRDTHLISHRHFPAKETLRPAEKRWACLCPPPHLTHLSQRHRHRSCGRGWTGASGAGISLALDYQGLEQGSAQPKPLFPF